MPRIDKQKRNRARELRAEPTDAEQKLWSLLRRKRLQGWHFRRQHPIPPIYADFACLAAKLIAEPDGSQHDLDGTDKKRDRSIKSRGWRILRFSNHEILRNPDGVAETILAELGPLPTLPRCAEAGNTDA